ncbi:MFS transporter [Isoptericola hypogeus]|uniref:MFS transporter n=1 Tax=Isoptericola hypogeus TaxID=300179 RepID=A0ABP4VYG4_9MICO
MMLSSPTRETAHDDARLPLGGLLALATIGFITVMTEAMPAGILPAMSADLGVTEAAAGQTVTIYAIGSGAAALPLTAATIGWPRRRLLLLAVTGFALTNAVTAISTSYLLTMAARLGAGVVAGLVWALLAGYARRMVAPGQRGRAMAIAMAGTPVALSIGVPAGTFMAGVVGWRAAFVIMSVLALAAIVWIVAAVPPFPGTARGDRLSIRSTFRIPGVAVVLFVILTVVTAHNVLYNYIAPYLASVGLADRVDTVLLVFGLASLVSIGVTGALIDRHLRALMIASTTLFALAATLLAAFSGTHWLVYVAAGVWGLAFGGVATLVQTALAEAAGAAGDVAQSMSVMTWNAGIAGGGILGGLVLNGWGPGPLPSTVLILVTAGLVAVLAARRHGFPDPTHRGAAQSAAPLEKAGTHHD